MISITQKGQNKNVGFPTFLFCLFPTLLFYPLHRTCRQIGNLKGREQRELANDHPVIQIYEKRRNTINRYIKRGKLDEDLAEVMKKLAKDKMLRAKSDVTYAKGAYEKEMEQAALKKEAQAKM